MDLRGNGHYMTTSEAVRGWFADHVPHGLFDELTEVRVDREEITVIGRIPAPPLAAGTPAAERVVAVEARVQEFRERTRQSRTAVAREARQRFGRTVSWGVDCAGERVLFAPLTTPVMTRLRQPERQVLDTLIAGGVARSRSDALAWCVRLVGRHTGDWLTDLRSSLEEVRRVRERGPDVEHPYGARADGRRAGKDASAGDGAG